MKKCSKCNKELNVNIFYKDKSKKGGIRGYCKVCDNERANKYRKERPEVHKKASYKYSIKNRYGMTLKDYEELMEKQKGVCKICENVCSLKQKLSIDHDHKTNKVRGLLCDNCNNGIARFHDKPELLNKAIKYLKK